MILGYRELLLLAAAFCVIVCGAVARKAGYSRWYGLLMLVPVLNIVMVWIFAFAQWPVATREHPQRNSS